MASNTPGINRDQPATSTTQASGQQNRQPTHEPRRGLDFMTIFTGILALFAFLSFVGLWIQLQDARQNFTTDQRPYVWFSQYDVPILQSGQTLKWNFHVTNFGKSPAVGVVWRCQVRLFEHKTPERKDMFAPIHHPEYKFEGLVVPPNDKNNWSTCESDEILNDSDIQRMATFDGEAKLTVFFEYYDMSWNVYTSQVCLGQRKLSLNTVMPCWAEERIR